MTVFSTFLILIFVVAAASATASATASSTEEIDYNSFEHDQGLSGNDEWKKYESKVSINQPLPHDGQINLLRPCALERFPEENQKGRPMNGYLLVVTEGGLNQISMGISNAVVLARILNATLIVPLLSLDKEWGDTSSFADVYDIAHFIATVEPDVPVLEKLPPEFEQSGPLQFRDSNGIHKDYFLVPPEKLVSNYLPILLQDGVLLIKAFHFQVGDNLPRHLERLRCRIIFHGLQFIEPIQRLGAQVVWRMRELSGGGPFLGLHIRFDKFWLNAWDGYLSPEVYRNWEMGGARLQYFGNLTNCSYFTDRPNPRDRGSGCFMNPLEVAAALKAMGIPASTPIYLASGCVAGGKRTMKTFHELWGSNVHTKESLLGEDLKPLTKFKTRLAAIDAIVALQSDLLMMTSPKMMSNWQILLQGQRFYWHNEKETFWMSDTKLRPLFQEPRVNMAEVSSRIWQERIWQRKRSWVRWEGKDFDKTSFAWPWHCVCNVESSSS